MQLENEHEDAVEMFQAAIETYERVLSMLERDPIFRVDLPNVESTLNRVRRYLAYNQAALSN